MVLNGQADGGAGNCVAIGDDGDRDGDYDDDGDQCVRVSGGC